MSEEMYKYLIAVLKEGDSFTPNNDPNNLDHIQLIYDEDFDSAAQQYVERCQLESTPSFKIVCIESDDPSPQIYNILWWEPGLSGKLADALLRLPKFELPSIKKSKKEFVLSYMRWHPKEIYDYLKSISSHS